MKKLFVLLPISIGCLMLANSNARAQNSSILLYGDNPTYVPVGQTFIDPGALASIYQWNSSDPFMGGTGPLPIYIGTIYANNINELDTFIPGTYFLSYSMSGVTASRTVIVQSAPPTQPEQDSDSDGVNDYRENKDGTDPNNATSFNPLSKGLVAYYPLDGNANDESGNGYDGDASRVIYAPDRSGAASTSGDFRDNAYIEIPGLRSLNNYPITYSVWMYLETYHSMLSGMGWGEMFLVGKDEPGVLNGAVISIHTGLDIQGAEHVDNVLGYSGFLTDYVPNLSKWTLVTLSIDTNRQATFYIDGLPIASWSAATQYNFEFTDLPFRISTPYIFDQFARQSFRGYMDSIRIYDRALSATEVAQLYINDTGCMMNPNSGLTIAADFLTSFGSQRYSSGVAEVTNDPASVGLFTQEQFNGNRTAGQSDVINSPMSYGLYTSESIMDLKMGGLMIQRNGDNAVVSFQPQTTTDLSLPFTNNGTPITNTIPMPGNKGFIRINAKP